MARNRRSIGSVGTHVDREGELRQLARAEQGLEELLQPLLDGELPDERLRLVFTCCHPALARHAQVALTLSTLGGLSTAEIARAFLTSEVTMAQRLVRAKRRSSRRASRTRCRRPRPSHGVGGMGRRRATLGGRVHGRATA